MKAIFVLTMDLPNPEAAATVLEQMDPPSIPHFAGEVRVAIGGDAQHVIDWLDEENPDG
jgi:hypothetical protein